MNQKSKLENQYNNTYITFGKFWQIYTECYFLKWMCVKSLNTVWSDCEHMSMTRDLIIANVTVNIKSMCVGACSLWWPYKNKQYIDK